MAQKTIQWMNGSHRTPSGEASRQQCDVLQDGGANVRKINYTPAASGKRW